MIAREDIIAIGRLVKPHGLSGELVAELDIDAELVDKFSCLIMEIDGIFVPMFVASCRARRGGSALLMFDDVADSEEASTLAGLTLYVRKDEYARVASEGDADDEMPVDFFVGFTVMDAATGDVIGTIEDVDDTTFNVLFIVRRADDSLVRIPAVDDLVAALNEDTRVISMYIPGGLLDL